MIEKKYITHNREPFFQLALDYISKESKVLDIGPGVGAFPEFCGRKDFYLLEGNQETCLLLNEKYKNVVHTSLPDVPFDQDFFDLVHCSHVVEHLVPEDLYQSLVNIDRILKPSGYLVISAPLLWSGFYNDLSHVKPYDPFIFEKYLCGAHLNSLTRKPISTTYKVVRIQYRYLNTIKEIMFLNESNNFFVRIFQSLYYRLKKLGLTKLEKTGFTIVLQKQ